MKCKHCGEAVDPERADLGYDYCTRDDCVKASDQYVLERDLGWSGPPVRAPVRDGGGWMSGLAPREPKKQPAPGSTTARIAELEAELDAALARETDPQQR